MRKLGVNVDHVATLRQVRIPKGVHPERFGVYPDPVKAALVCEKAGAHAIVMHLREDRRHVQDADVVRAREKLSIKFNLEMSIAPSIVKVAVRARPEQATLVPEKREEKTTEGGLDLFGRKAALRKAVETLKKKKISVSLFIDPDPRPIREALRIGADAIELHTGDYANQTARAGIQRELTRLREAVALARSLGLTVHAGHGLDYENVSAVAAIPGFEEFNIGYSIVTRSLWVGLENAVSEMLGLIR